MNPQKPKAIDDAVLLQILGGASRDAAQPPAEPGGPGGPSVVIPQGPFSSFYHS